MRRVQPAASVASGIRFRVYVRAEDTLSLTVILEIRDGPSAGGKIGLQPGQSVRVGRTARADFVLPEDSHLSGVHFSVECDEKGCVLRDLGSSDGTLVNGQRVTRRISTTATRS